MDLAISNIGWDKDSEAVILPRLRGCGVKGVEVAPTKIEGDWESINEKTAVEYRKKLNDAGLVAPSLQAIVFGKPHLQLFHPDCRLKFLDHFRFVADLAQVLGAEVIVFGAPKNRKRGHLSYHEALEIASRFFFEAAEICAKRQCIIGLEHNPVEYGCDFITNVSDAQFLVKQVSHPNFQLHLDSSGIHLAGGDIYNTIKSAERFAHYHASEPFLESCSVTSVVDHVSAAKALRESKYTGWVSIEMKVLTEQSMIFDSINMIRKFYFLN